MFDVSQMAYYEQFFEIDLFTLSIHRLPSRLDLLSFLDQLKHCR
jgi:hypothetical protein